MLYNLFIKKWLYSAGVILHKKRTGVVQVYLVTFHHCIIVIMTITATRAWIEKPFITDTPFK